jgi:hypothetical protein
MNQKSQKYLLYVGLFVAGAVITPMYLSLFGSGDRPSTSETKPTAATEFTDNTNTNLFNTPDNAGTASTPGFAPNDSRQMIEQDYTIQQRSLRTATTLPQFAREQSPPAPYPNYAAIPSPKISVPATVTPKSVIAPSNNKSPQSTSDTLTGLNPDRAIALDTAKDLPNSIQSVPANTLFTPRPDGNNAQIPILNNDPNKIQTNWLRNNTNRPAATGEIPPNIRP